MIRVDQEKSILEPAGYAALIERYGLDVIPNWHISRVTTSGTHRVDSQADVTEEVYPPHYWPGDKLGDHLEFGWKRRCSLPTETRLHTEPDPHPISSPRSARLAALAVPNWLVEVVAEPIRGDYKEDL